MHFSDKNKISNTWEIRIFILIFVSKNTAQAEMCKCVFQTWIIFCFYLIIEFCKQNQHFNILPAQTVNMLFYILFFFCFALSSLTIKLNNVQNKKKKSQILNLARVRGQAHHHPTYPITKWYKYKPLKTSVYNY